jgi:hypothetical protein
MVVVYDSNGNVEYYKPNKKKSEKTKKLRVAFDILQEQTIKKLQKKIIFLKKKCKKERNYGIHEAFESLELGNDECFCDKCCKEKREDM